MVFKRNVMVLMLISDVLKFIATRSHKIIHENKLCERDHRIKFDKRILHL